MKVLISPSSFGKISNEPIKLLEKHNIEYVINPFGRKLEINETIDLARDCDGIIAGVEDLTEKTLKELPKLKVISRVGVGMDNIDFDFTKKHNITVLNTPDGPTQAVCELTVGLAYNLLRKINIANNDLKNKVWKKQTGNLLIGKTIGIIGLGRIGKLVGETFKKLGNEVIGYDLYPDQNWSDKNDIKYLGLNEVLESSDILCLHVSNNSKGYLLDNEQLSIMKKEAFLINLSRGGVVNENALYNKLINNELAGAAIDVFEKEPYNGNLIELENTILTPHLGSYAKEGKLKMEIDATLNLINSSNYVN